MLSCREDDLDRATDLHLLFVDWRQFGPQATGIGPREKELVTLILQSLRTRHRSVGAAGCTLWTGCYLSAAA